MVEPALTLGAIESPCIGTCTLGPEGLCIGCFRSGEEIAGWLAFSPEQRRDIISALPERAQRLFDDG
ncbi:MAG: DUF1289 domain-containing protein [Wenzhouxiangella sp.]|nr:MAG: DUF1289 domain-containing protein [Wenzhouxiangella sp.]